MDILQVIRLTENIRKNSAKLSASLVNGESTVKGQAVRLMGTVRGSRTGEAADAASEAGTGTLTASAANAGEKEAGTGSTAEKAGEAGVLRFHCNRRQECGCST